MTTITADIGADNVFEIDLPIAIVEASDKIWFTAKRHFSEADGSAVIRKGKNVAGLTGISVTDAPNGKFQVQVDAADTSALTDEALMYDVKVKPQSSNKAQQIQRGVLRLRKVVTQSTS